MKLAAPAALILLLAALVAGCGGGGTTTVIERTVTEKAAAVGDDDEGQGGNDEGQSGGDEAKGENGGGDTGAGETEGGGQAGQAEDKIEEPSAVVHLQSFRSPSGNIGCIMFEGGARCDIGRRAWSPLARPASCPEQVDFGQGLSVDHTGKASFVCAGDTALDPSGTTLDYGEASELGGTQCISRSEGVTCANHSGHGFFISMQSYKLF